MKRYQVSGFEVMEYEEAESTNTVAEGLPAGDLKDRQVVLTYRQTCGRGQVGNEWESRPECNISMTVILKPQHLEAGKQFAVSMVIALGGMDFVSRYAKGCTVKWPNDIYVGDKKISGILIEHCIAGANVRSSLCGIGININQTVFVSDAPNPVSLFQLTGQVLPLENALADLLMCIDRRYRQIHDYENLEKDFIRHLYRRQGMYKWQDAEGVFSASISGVDEYGQLILTDSQGKKRIYGFKEVKYL